MVPDVADELLRFIDASPTPFHVCRTATAALDEAGWTRLDERDAWPAKGGKHYVVRGGSLVAWASPRKGAAAAARVVGGHTDSPNLRLKQHHDIQHEGAAVLALEPYGGPLVGTWLDRDLGVAGHLVLRDGTEHLVHVAEPVLRVPHLAIHLDRESKGRDIDLQRHLNAVWAVGSDTPFLSWLCEREGLRVGDVLGFELMVHDVQPSALIGANGELVSAPRLDNQATCFAGLQALLAAEAVDGVQPVLALFDHEEVGSTSQRGAQSDLLATVLERIVLAAGGTRDDYHRAVAASLCVSGDMAHATHPNHADKHEPLHHIRLGGGPVLKVNQNLRYASEPHGMAAFALACDQAGVPMQRYVHRADLPCGSTIGPLSAARTGMTTVDVGAPQLAMHSAREVMSAVDIDLYTRALTAFFSPQGRLPA